MINKIIEERESDIFLPTVAYGYSFFQVGKSLSFEKTMKEADDQMYNHKKTEKEKTKI